MVLRRINNLILIFIILCSASFYQLSFLGSVQTIVELAGIGVIVFLIAIHGIYSDQKTIPHHFTVPIALIILSLVTSTFMAKYGRDQDFWQTIYAQRDIYYYFLYFLLHQMKIKTKDMETIFYGLGIVYVILYLLQYFLYPTIISDGIVLWDRGTVRIYIYGSAYFNISFLMALQYFLRTNKFKYLFLLLVFFVIFVLTGGRLDLVIVLFITILFVIFDKKVKSRLFMALLGITGIALLFIIFQNIFESIVTQSHSDMGKGENYVRILAMKYYLTDFFKHPLAYLTGNGMGYHHSEYGRFLLRIDESGFNLSDIGIIGQYAIYGAFFVAGIIMLIVRSLKIKMEPKFYYIKYQYISVIIALLTAPIFDNADMICFFMCVAYLIDVSNNNISNIGSNISKMDDT